jgi:hypothetical protein
MPTVYVARSQALEKWAAEVGLTKHVLKVGVADDDPAAAIAALNAESHAGSTDWTLLKKVAVEAADEAQVIARLARRETAVDPKYYPRLRGAAGIFKIKLANAQNQLMVDRALAGDPTRIIKFKPADFADYLLKNAVD